MSKPIEYMLSGCLGGALRVLIQGSYLLRNNTYVYWIIFMILGTSFLIYRRNVRDSRLNIDRNSKLANNYSYSGETFTASLEKQKRSLKL